jgi:hypothetical protein
MLMKCTVQEAKFPVKKISSGSIALRDLIPALKGERCISCCSYL